ncbi:MAG: Mur ligase family protein [Sarcina sp.]
MEIVFLRFMDGKNIYSDEKVIDFLIRDISKDVAKYIYNNYESIQGKLGLMGMNLNFEYKKAEARMFFIYRYKFVSKYIIESLVSGIDVSQIILNAKKIVDNSFEVKVVDNFLGKQIPYYFMDENTVQIGYGSKAIVAKSLEEIPLELGDIRIPIITITGSNGKTTTARLIYKILLSLGYRCGLTSTGGVYVNGETIREGDTTGYYSAKQVLNNKDVDIAVLEVARGGIVKNGLAYDQSDIAIITTISNDHIGMEGARSIEDLLKIKMLVAQVVNDKGIIIARAKKLLVDKLDRDNIIFFDSENAPLLQGLMKQHEVYYVDNGEIIEGYKNVKKKVAMVKDIKFTYDGASASNIKNIICALIAVDKIHNNMSEVLDVVKLIECDNKENIGRQNIFSYHKGRVLVDYGHNEESFLEIYDLIKKINDKGKVISIIGAPGDRSDAQIMKLGNIAAKNSDYIIVKELKNKRGRVSGECANLLLYGINKAKFNLNDVITIIDERNAFDYGLSIIKDGDILIYFVQDEENIKYAIKILE